LEGTAAPDELSADVPDEVIQVEIGGLKLELRTLYWADGEDGELQFELAVCQGISAATNAGYAAR
jgi:hypothetical protein